MGIEVRELTDAEVEAAARVMWDASESWPRWPWQSWQIVGNQWRERWRDMARAVLRHAWATGPDAVLSALVESLRRERFSVERERDEARERARIATQQIIDAIGSSGPESIEQIASRVVRDLDAARTHVVDADIELGRVAAERDALRAQLAKVRKAWAAFDGTPVLQHDAHVDRRAAFLAAIRDGEPGAAHENAWQSIRDISATLSADPNRENPPPVDSIESLAKEWKALQELAGIAPVDGEPTYASWLHGLIARGHDWTTVEELAIDVSAPDDLVARTNALIERERKT